MYFWICKNIKSILLTSIKGINLFQRILLFCSTFWILEGKIATSVWNFSRKVWLFYDFRIGRSHC